MQVFVVVETPKNDILSVKVFSLQSKMEDYMDSRDEEVAKGDIDMYWFIKEVE